MSTKSYQYSRSKTTGGQNKSYSYKSQQIVTSQKDDNSKPVTSYAIYEDPEEGTVTQYQQSKSNKNGDYSSFTEETTIKKTTYKSGSGMGNTETTEKKSGYTKTVNTIAKGINQSLGGNKKIQKPEEKIKLTAGNNVRTTKSVSPYKKSVDGPANLKRKTMARGGDYDNILITHIIYTKDPNAEFHIVEDLDTRTHNNPPVDLKKLRQSKSYKNPTRPGKTEIKVTCAKPNLKKKKENMCKTLKFVHIAGTGTQLAKPETYIVSKKNGYVLADGNNGNYKTYNPASNPKTKTTGYKTSQKVGSSNSGSYTETKTVTKTYQYYKKK